MSEFENVNTARKKLMDSLGEREKEYLNLMKLWFKMKLRKEEIDSEFKKFLTPDQLHLHNQLLQNLLNKCFGLTVPALVTSESSVPRKKYACFQGRFEPLDPTMYVVTERKEVKAEPPLFMIHERLLPDHSVAMARLMYGAWEIGLDGSTSTTADLLVVATQKFLKNIITAVIGRRKGYKIDQNFVHGISEPISNPWLRNVANRPEKKFHSLKCDPSESNILTPSERPSREFLEEEIAFKLASSDYDSISLPISLYDLITTLKVHPSLVASNFIYTVNCERIWARICHPSWDE